MRGKIRGAGVRLAVITVVMALAAACGDDGGNASAQPTATSGGGSSPSSAQPSTTVNATPVEMAVGVDLSGSTASAGLSAKAGVEAAVYALNKAGGINGRKINAKYYDLKSVGTEAAPVIREAVTSKPDAVTGFFSSPSLTPSAQLVAQSGLPFVNAGVLVPPLDTAPQSFSTTSGNRGTARALVAALKQILPNGDLKGKKFAFAGPAGSPAIDDRVKFLKEALQQQGAELSQEIRDPGAVTAWSAQAANLVSSGVDGLLTVNSDPNIVVIGKALAVAGFQKPFISDTGSNADSVFKAVASPNFYAVRDTVFITEDSPLFAELKAAGGSDRDALGGSYFTRAYAAMFVTAKGLAACGIPCSADNFGKTVRGLGDIAMPTGVSFGPFNFASINIGPTTGQLYAWDDAKKTIVEKGAKFKIEQ